MVPSTALVVTTGLNGHGWQGLVRRSRHRRSWVSTQSGSRQWPTGSPPGSNRHFTAHCHLGVRRMRPATFGRASEPALGGSQVTGETWRRVLPVRRSRRPCSSSWFAPQARASFAGVTVRTARQASAVPVRPWPPRHPTSTRSPFRARSRRSVRTRRSASRSSGTPKSGQSKCS